MSGTKPAPDAVTVALDHLDHLDPDVSLGGLGRSYERLFMAPGYIVMEALRDMIHVAFLETRTKAEEAGRALDHNTLTTTAGEDVVCSIDDLTVICWETSQRRLGSLSRAEDFIQRSLDWKAHRVRRSIDAMVVQP